MLKKWIKTTIADCEVIQFSKKFNVYPIFKNGRSSLIAHAKCNNLTILKNKEISKLNDITIYIRDPLKRFISGVHTFFYLGNLELNKKNLKKIENFEFVDRHFVPQSIWLLHLYKFYRGDVILKNVNEVYSLVTLRQGQWSNNPMPWTPLSGQLEEQIKMLDYKKFVDVDYNVLNKYIDRKIPLSTVVKEIKNALS
jgi:hypothetical protein